MDALSISPGEVDETVALLAGRRVLVVGDLVLDEYLTGRPARLSREAPVLVLEEIERDYRAGSAGSPAANIVSLGSQATIVGALGDDPHGERLRQGLQGAGIGCEGLLRVADLQTPTKTRVLAEGFTGGLHGRQQVLRIDRTAQLPDQVQRQCAKELARLAPSHEAILVSDYCGGIIGQEMLAALQTSGRRVAVDSQGDIRRFRGMELVKVNQAEAQQALAGGDVMAGGDALRRELQLRYLVVTLGANGIAVFSDAGSAVVPAAKVTEVFDVTGAGDTVIAVLTLALVAQLPILRAIVVANAAAGLVVRRLGVATVVPSELRAALHEYAA